MDITEVEVAGPCKITLGGLDLGHTLDGVMLTAEREFLDVRVDRYSAPIDKVLTSGGATVTFKLAQNNFRNKDLSMPETSSYDGAGVKDRVDLGADNGYSLRQNAQQLIIHPLKNAATDLSDDIVLYKAVSAESVELPYRVDEQLVLELTFHALVDEGYGTGRRLGHVGPADVS